MSIPNQTPEDPNLEWDIFPAALRREIDESIAVLDFREAATELKVLVDILAIANGCTDQFILQVRTRLLANAQAIRCVASARRLQAATQALLDIPIDIG